MKNLSALFTIILLALCLSISGCDDTADGISGDNGTSGINGTNGEDAQLNITSDTTWTTGETYVIQRNIVVKEGVTLTIQPGAVVSLNPGICIYVDGHFVAQGTSTDHITIKNEGTIGNGSFYLTSTSTGNNLQYIDFENTYLTVDSTATISYCNFTCDASAHASGMLTTNDQASVVVVNNCNFNGISGSSQGIMVYSSGTVELTNCSINNIYYGVYCPNGSSSLVLTNCSIENSAYYGVYSVNTSNISIIDSKISSSNNGIYLQHTTDGTYEIDLQNVTIDNCTTYGIYAYQNADITMTNCIISNCTAGLHLYGDNITVNADTCSIINNTQYGVSLYIDSQSSSITNSNIFGNIVYNVYNTDSADHNFTSNWWGTTDTTTIDTYIYDHNDSASRGLVDYSSYLSAPVTVTGCGW